LPKVFSIDQVDHPKTMAILSILKKDKDKETSSPNHRQSETSSTNPPQYSPSSSHEDLTLLLQSEYTQEPSSTGGSIHRVSNKNSVLTLFIESPTTGKWATFGGGDEVTGKIIWRVEDEELVKELKVQVKGYERTR
jgi:hypothetical protein